MKTNTYQRNLINYYLTSIGKGWACFEYTKAFQVLPDLKEKTVKQLFSDMARQGLLPIGYPHCKVDRKGHPSL